MKTLISALGHIPLSSVLARSSTLPQRAFFRNFGASRNQLRYFQSRPFRSDPTLRQAFRRLRRPYSNDSSKPSKPTSPNPTSSLGSPEPSLSLSQRLRKLSREYGWSAVGVYFLLSALDFPFCFLAVRTLGTDRIGRWESVIVGWAWSVISLPFRRDEVAETSVAKAVELGNASDQNSLDNHEAASAQDAWGVGHAQQRNTAPDASIWTQLALAYAIHKSFIFLRVPLTAAVTPKVVRVLRNRGWNIGKRTKGQPKPKSD